MTSPLLLGGRYELGPVVGSGGTAQVHRGRDTRMGRDVAVKVLRPELARDPVSQARFRREGQSAASLHSPSIVSVYDTGDVDMDGISTPYIVMEYVEGQTLRDLLARDGKLPVQQALAITIAVCDALEAAHLAGIVHRDIKPANVLLTPDNRVKVTDFGIARTLTGTSTMTQTAAVVGSAQYLSPEQARGESVDSRSDVYSTGCLLFELLTGVPPFSGESALAVAYQHVREQPVPPSSLEPDLPPGADSVVLVAMAKDPADRYATAGLMRADLRRLAAGETPAFTPVTVAEPRPTPDDQPVPTTVVLRPAGRRRRRVLAFSGLGLAVIAVFVVAMLIARGLLSSSASDLNAPDLVGQSVDNARDTLHSDGLDVGSITSQFTGRNDTGQVVGQSPPGGVLLRKGERVDLIVSKGIKYVTVPSGLVGLTEAEAKSAVTAAGLVPHIVSKNSDAPKGQVLSVDPGIGSSQPAGSDVTLKVSNAHVSVPDVNGDPESTAVAVLQEAGFEVAVRDAAVYSRKHAGEVVSQYPSGKTYAANGSTVTIYVDVKPKPTASPSPSSSASSSASPGPSASPSP